VQVKQRAKGCADVKGALKILFPTAFENDYALTEAEHGRMKALGGLVRKFTLDCPGDRMVARSLHLLAEVLYTGIHNDVFDMYPGLRDVYRDIFDKTGREDVLL
jgi:hypothetical protein